MSVKKEKKLVVNLGQAYGLINDQLLKQGYRIKDDKTLKMIEKEREAIFLLRWNILSDSQFYNALTKLLNRILKNAEKI